MFLLCLCVAKPRPEALEHLLLLPFTKYEDSLIQSYALSPPSPSPSPQSSPSALPTLTPRSTAILQTLLITRLIHAGLLPLAILLDAEFNVRGLEGEGVGKVVEERKRMIGEVWGVLGGVERAEVEDGVRRVRESEQGKMRAVVPPPPPSSHLPPRTPRKAANGANPNPSGDELFRTPQRTPLPSNAATPNSAAKSFTLGRARPSSGTAFVTPNSNFQTPLNQNQSQMQGQSRKTPLSSSVHRAASHANGRAIPANQVKNAFYTPPSAPSPLSFVGPSASTAVVNETGTGEKMVEDGDGDVDAEMREIEKDGEEKGEETHDGNTEPSSSQPTHPNLSQSQSQSRPLPQPLPYAQKPTPISAPAPNPNPFALTDEEDSNAPRFERSVFVDVPPARTRPRKSLGQSASEKRRSLGGAGAQSVDKLIPGAFLDGPASASPISPVSAPPPVQTAPAPTHAPTHAPEPSAAPKPPVSAPKSSSTSTKTRTNRRKIPGGFSLESADEDSEVEGEDRDSVAPLPAPPPAKKSRSMRTVKAGETPYPTRRSSRLSQAGSVRGEESDVEVSPVKARTGTTTGRKGGRASGNESASAGSATGPSAGPSVGTTTTPARRGRKKKTG